MTKRSSTYDSQPYLKSLHYILADDDICEIYVMKNNKPESVVPYLPQTNTIHIHQWLDH